MSVRVMLIWTMCVVCCGCTGDDGQSAGDALVIIPLDQAFVDSGAGDAHPDDALGLDSTMVMTDAGEDAGRRDAAALPVLAEPIVIPLNQSSDINIQPSVAIGHDGRIAVSWCENGQDDLGIAFALLEHDGSIVAEPYALDTDRAGVQNEPVVCALRSGGYVVVWSTDSQRAGREGQNLSMRLRVVGAEGLPASDDEQIVDTGMPGNHWLADVACDPAGGFIVVGSNSEENGTFGVFAQRYTQDGRIRGTPIQMNEDPQGNQTFPSIAIDESGAALIAWEDHRGFGTPQEVYRITARRLGAEDTRPMGPEITVVESLDEVTRPDLSLDSNSGDAVIGVIMNQRKAGLFTVEGATDAVDSWSVPEDGISYYPALTYGGNGVHLLLYLEGVRDGVTARLRRLDESGVGEDALILAQGNLPPYSASLDARDGRVVVAWTERGEGNTYYVRIAGL